MRNRKQQGQIIRIGDRWYVRYWERRNIGGTIERKRVTHSIGNVSTRGKRPPADIKTEADRHMATVNQCSIPNDRIIPMSDFVENVYLPWAKANLKPSTHKGYRDAWEDHIKALSSRERGSLKDMRTFTVQRWLNQIGEEDLARNSLKRIQSVLSGIFKLAKRLGFFDGVNPVQDTAVNPHAAAPVETYAYSLEEIQNILAVLPEPAGTAFALAAFTGLRRGEIEGLEWTDYHDGELHVCRSIWNGKATTPKTKKSCSPIPVIRQLAERLEMHRLRCGTPQGGPVFANSAGRPQNINNLLSRVILPAVNVCVRCGVTEGKAHLKQDHQYKRDARIPEWHGWHAARRGLGSNLYRMGVPDKTIQRILRHSNVNVTLSYYIKSTTSDVVEAMGRFSDNFALQSADQNVRDSDGTLKQGSGAMPESVN